VPADFCSWTGKRWNPAPGDENASARNQRTHGGILERETGLEPATLSFGKANRPAEESPQWTPDKASPEASVL